MSSGRESLHQKLTVSPPITIQVLPSDARITTNLDPPPEESNPDADTLEVTRESPVETIPIPTDNQDYDVPQYLKTLFIYSTYLGLTFGKLSPNECSTNSLQTYTQMGYFGLNAILSVIQGLLLLRNAFYIPNPDSTLYIYIGEICVAISIRIAYVHNQTRNFDSLVSLQRTLEKKSAEKTGNRLIPVLVLSLTEIIAILSVIGGVGIVDFKDWDLRSIFNYHSNEMRWFFLEWTYSNDTQVTHEFTLQYSDLLFGIIGILGDICSNVLDNFVLDVLLVSSYVALLHTEQFITRTSNDLQFQNSNRNLDSNEGHDLINRYKFLRKIVEDINSAFENLYKLTHIHNLFTCAHFTHQLIVKKDVTLIAASTVKIGKVVGMYYISNKCTKVNGFMKRLIREYRSSLFSTTDPVDLQILLDDIQNNPVGIGTGSFLIDETLISKFIGVVISYFFMLVDSKLFNSN